jgi:hypothetical protein
MAKVVRDGGLPVCLSSTHPLRLLEPFQLCLISAFQVALVARFSAIPGHFTTAVFSTVGMNVWIFTVGVILSFPKQVSSFLFEFSLNNHSDLNSVLMPLPRLCSSLSLSTSEPS